MPVARQWLSSDHVMATTILRQTIEELMKAVFSVRFVSRLYNEEQLPL
jgi:hypothetical protein